MTVENATTATPAPAVVETPAAAPAVELTPFEQAMAIIQKEAPPAAEPAAAELAPPATETAPPVVPPAEAKPDVMETRLSKLIEEQKSLRLMKEQIETEKKAMEAKEAWFKKLDEDPLSALAERGHTYEKLTELAVDPGRAALKRTDAKTLSEVEQLRQQVVQMQKEAQQAKAQVERQAILSQAKAMAAAGDDFEYVRTFGAEEKALQLVENHFAQTGQMLGGGDFGEAIKLAMGHLEKAYEADIERGLTAKKAKSKLAPVSTTPAPVAAANSGQRQTPRTLTNSQAIAAPPAAEPENLSVDELRARAIAIIQRA